MYLGLAWALAMRKVISSCIGLDQIGLSNVQTVYHQHVLGPITLSRSRNRHGLTRTKNMIQSACNTAADFDNNLHAHNLPTEQTASCATAVAVPARQWQDPYQSNSRLRIT